MKKFDVKYVRIMRFCFYCGCIDHTKHKCLLPEDKKLVRFGTGLWVSPFKKSIHRIWSVPTVLVQLARKFDLGCRPSDDESQAPGQDKRTRSQDGMEEDEGQSRNTTNAPSQQENNSVNRNPQAFGNQGGTIALCCPLQWHYAGFL